MFSIAAAPVTVPQRISVQKTSSWRARICRPINSDSADIAAGGADVQPQARLGFARDLSLVPAIPHFVKEHRERQEPGLAVIERAAAEGQVGIGAGLLRVAEHALRDLVAEPARA